VFIPGGSGPTTASKAPRVLPSTQIWTLEADRRTSTGLAGFLKEKGFRKLFVCGLATDFCVAWTALDARTAGFDITLVEDASRAIDLDGSLVRARADLHAAGVRFQPAAVA